MSTLLYLTLGLIAGTLSGMFGIGGGTILIPGLVFLAGLTQQEAQGTTLAIMLLPIGLLAVIRYYQTGHVRFDIAAFICLGFKALVQLFDLAAHRHAKFSVEVGKRFVKQEDLRVTHNRASHGDTLALSARQLSWITLKQWAERQNFGGAVNFCIDITFALFG